VRGSAAEGTPGSHRTPRHRSGARGAPGSRVSREESRMNTAISAVEPATTPGRTTEEGTEQHERPLRVVVINGSPNRPSKTMGLVGVVLDALARRLRIETQQVDVYHLGSGFSTAIERDDLSAEAEEELDRKSTRL